MLAYVVRRLLLMIPTLLGIMVLNFVIINAAPGGPVEQVLARLQGTAVDATARFSGGSQGEAGGGQRQAGSPQGEASKYRGARGLDPKFIADLERQFGFDKPAPERFFIMMSR
jgi:microcin C transport system permease protein